MSDDVCIRPMNNALTKKNDVKWPFAWFKFIRFLTVAGFTRNARDTHLRWNHSVSHLSLVECFDASDVSLMWANLDERIERREKMFATSKCAATNTLHTVNGSRELATQPSSQSIGNSLTSRQQNSNSLRFVCGESETVSIWFLSVEFLFILSCLCFGIVVRDWKVKIKRRKRYFNRRERNY